MKSLVTTIAISCLFFLASCNSVFQTPPLIEKAPDTLSQPTVTIVPKDTRTELPKGAWVKTDPSEKTTVTLEEDTVVTVKPVQETPSTPSSIPNVSEKAIEVQEKPQEVVLPKNTEVILPENTYLKTSDSTVVFLEGGSEVTLPPGTEISITKVNWYAIMFYCLLVGFGAWYYLQGRCQPEDKDNDGFIDDPKLKKKKKV